VWRGTERDGESPDRGLLKEWPAEGPRRIWQASGIGQGFSSVSVVGVWTTGTHGGIVGVDRVNQQLAFLLDSLAGEEVQSRWLTQRRLCQPEIKTVPDS
jgi:hypothetical protein